MNKQLYSINELADILGVSHTLVRKWCAEKKVQFGFVKNQIMFNDEMVYKIKDWYTNNKPKTGRPNKPENIFSLTDLSKKINVDIRTIREDIINDSITASSINRIYCFSKEQFDKALVYYADKNIKEFYTANEVAEYLEMDSNLLRFLCKLGRIDYTKTETGRFLFTLQQFTLLSDRLNSNLPLIDDEELKTFEKEKKDYYKDWYNKNKFKLKIRRKK